MSVVACDSALLPTADDVSSAVTSSHSAAPVAAGARDTSLCANGGFSLELIYYGELGDESDSKKSVRSPGSPWATQSEPSKRRLAHTTREVSSITLSLGLMVMSLMVHHLCRVIRTHKCAMSTITTMARAIIISDTNYLCWYQSEGSWSHNVASSLWVQALATPRACYQQLVWWDKYTSSNTIIWCFQA